jgi:predicted permease
MERLAAAVSPEIERLATFTSEKLTLGTGPEAQQVAVIDYGPAYFDVLGLKPALGVLPGAVGEVSPDVVVISHALWEQRFGRAPDVVGRTLTLATRTYTIVAVTPRGFGGIDTEPVDVWLPLDSRAPAVLQKDWRTEVSYASLRTIARLRDGVDREAAALRAGNVYWSLLMESQPEENKATAAKMTPDRLLLGDILESRPPGRSITNQVALWVTAMSVLVMLIACGNAGSLLLVSGLRRDRELAIKTALGASRARLAREFLLEAGVLALGAGVAAWLFVITAGELARKLLLPPITATIDAMDLRLVLLTVGVSLGATFLLGTLPALRLTTQRRLTQNPAAVAAAGRRSSLLDLFAGLQLALSVPLIVGAGLFALSLWHARQEDFGFDTSHLVVVSTNLTEVGRAQDTHAMHRVLQERLASVPGVRNTTLVMSTPWRGALALPLQVPGHPFGVGSPVPFFNAVDPTFFDVMGLHFIEGRTFTATENTPKGPAAIIVNQSFARLYWPGEPAVGRCIDISQVCRPIVGVVSDAAMWAQLDRAERDQTMKATYYGPAEQFLDTMSSSRAVLVRSAGNPYDLLPALRRTAQATGTGLPFVDVWSFDDVFLPMLRPWRLGSTLFVAFGAMSLVIAFIGLAVVTAYGVTQRTRELGIRMVLGADPRTLIQLVLRRSVTAICGGLAAGMILAYVGGRWLTSVLFGITARDWAACFIVGAVMIAIGLIAAWLPARRVVRIDPAAALRPE